MPSVSRRVPAIPLAAGAALFAAGLAAALTILPEWNARPPRDPLAPGRIGRELGAMGGTLTRARASLDARPEAAKVFERAYRVLGSGARGWLVATGGATSLHVDGTLEIPTGGSGACDVTVGPDGSAYRVAWMPGGWLGQFSAPDEAAKKARDAFAGRLAEWIAGGRPAGGKESSFSVSGTPFTLRPLVPRPGEPKQTLVVTVPAGVLYQISRELSDPDPARLTLSGSQVTRGLRKAAPFAVVLVVTLALFLVLLFKRRLNFRIGLALGAGAGLAMLAGGLSAEMTSGGAWTIVPVLLSYTVSVLLLAILWIVAESLLRDTVPGFTTSLDAFASGRLGPRGGRALLAGLGAGAALCGVSLLGFAAAARLAGEGVHPTAPSFPFPLFTGPKNPLWDGTFHAALFVLFVALSRFFLPRRWAGSAAAALFALFLSNGLTLHPWGASLVVSLAAAAILLAVFDGYGLASLLSAALSAPLLLCAAVSVRTFPDQLLPGTVSFALLAVLLALGWAGSRRPEREDEARVAAPEYVRRLENERRVKYEMDLLARMQLSLLPEGPPRVPGLELAVRTELATEAGGDLYHFLTDEEGHLWIAAGDVSGHGYSCGIQQAMVMAALGSLVKAGRSPAGILAEIDRVLRTGRHERLFTSLLLLRLEPASGTGVFSNAGHPYPLLVAEGRCRELSAAGLPLGQGPARSYGEIPLDLPPGGVLVLASDGLYEGLDRFDVFYGYDRPQEVLEGVGLWRRPPGAIVEALFADWRRHVGEGPPADDTTVLVVKRPLF